MSAHRPGTPIDNEAYRIPSPHDASAATYATIIQRAISRPQGMVVLPPLEATLDREQQNALMVDVLKAKDPTQAYMRISGKRPIPLDHHAPGWGCVYFGVILPRVQAGVFQCPPLQQAQRVAIKRLSNVVVHAALEQGKRENPFTELELMHRFGDNHHVLGMVEALQDDQFLYIIMPYCEHGSLVERIPWQLGVQEREARQLFRNILENITYLHSRGVCHRDLSPDNCMMLNGRIVFTDLAMSIRIPLDNSVVTGHGGFGKAAYLPPEVCLNYPFDTKSCDLWSAAVILFNLVTGLVAWTEPMPGNLCFRYLVLARGLTRGPVNERAVEVLMGERSSVLSVAHKCLELSPELLDLLGGVLHVSYPERWNMEQVVNCDWVQNQEHGAPL
jgi:serine/threonine protein kinase